MRNLVAVELDMSGLQSFLSSETSSKKAYNEWVATKPHFVIVIDGLSESPTDPSPEETVANYIKRLKSLGGRPQEVSILGDIMLCPELFIPLSHFPNVTDNGGLILQLGIKGCQSWQLKIQDWKRVPFEDFTESIRLLDG